MAKKITAEEVAAAELELVKVKKSKAKPEERQRVADEVAALRSEFRSQEEAAGRRSGAVAVEEA